MCTIGPACTSTAEEGSEPDHRGLDTEVPLSLLRKHAGAKDSGEIIVAADDGLEVHVYLLEGRVAWATSSTAPNTLTNYLIKECGVEKAALREVVEECRRSNARFGDTLIEWNVASADQVRAALHAQISEALHTLVGVRTERSIFLPRQLDYSPELTFDAEEVAPAATPGAAPAATLSAAPAATATAAPPTPAPRKSRPTPPPTPRSASTRPSGRPKPARPRTPTPTPALKSSLDTDTRSKIVRAVETALPGAIWARVVGPAATPESVAGDDVLRKAALGVGVHGATAVTLRSPSGTILGHVASSSNDWAFCGFPSGANVVRANAVLTRTMRQVAPSAVGRALSRRAAPVSEDRTLATLLTAIRALMRQTEEMRAGLVLRMGAPRYAGAVQDDAQLSSLAEVAIDCVGALPATLSGFFPATDRDAGGGRDTMTASLETESHWHYGSVLSAESELFLWLVLAPQTPRGAGRVLLKKLIRQLSDDESPSVTGLWPSSGLDSSGSFERARTVPPQDEAPRGSSAFDEVRYEDEETSSVYSIASSRKRGKPPRGGSGAFG